ncbi:hypothetical protein A3715_03980 [Oleiphilus sp. HI0009]|nr:hypothetical protein A3715_03980 [Oleiphilus sp. HI0009]KZY61859.1 hypothetical protein A3738_13435 [Oleiphilus sp. HI0066]KZY68396.1 hypothetical protein A3739_11145 [Oleiphilus sp. HI0067]
MLASHSEVTFVPETSMLRRFVFGGKLGKAEDIAVNQELLWSDEKVKRLGLSEGDFDEGLKPAQLYEQIITKGVSTLYVGDKDPKLIEYLPLLVATFPESVIVHIKRDPRDVLASKKKADWSKSRPSSMHIAAGYAQEKAFQSFKMRSGFKNIVEVVYEDLISDPESVLREVCAQMEITFERRMLNFGAASEKLVSQEEMQWKGETLGPLLTNNANKWMAQLTPFEIVVCEGVNSVESSAQSVSLANRCKGAFFVLALQLIAPAYNLMRRYTYRKFQS